MNPLDSASKTSSFYFKGLRPGPPIRTLAPGPPGASSDPKVGEVRGTSRAGLANVPPSPPSPPDPLSRAKALATAVA